MNIKGKKLIALFLIFSLAMLSVNLYAKEKRGAKLLITKKDGGQIKGELITVKPNSLLLLDSEGKDVSIDIVDIKVIRVVKKSKALLGAGLGIVVGGGGGALLSGSGYKMSMDSGERRLLLGAFGVAAGLLIGVITGALLGTDKTIQIEGMTDLEIQDTMDKLRKQARIRDYR
jgi:hypothetical protein